MKSLSLIATLVIMSCDPSGSRASSGFAAVERKGGPIVLWDLEHRPLPEIPLPNDQAMRLDVTSPTGRRVNISTEALTRYESRVRATFNRLDGFGAYGPITARFSKALDLQNLVRRHRDNLDFRDDAVFLLNVDRRCERFGEEVALDFGRGRFPITLFEHSKRREDPLAPRGYRLEEGDNRLFRFDPEGESSSVLVNQWNEDVNGNGQLDDGEDRDADGVLDVANFVEPAACDGLAFGTPAHDRCIADNLMGWYERESETLILRPVWALEERCTYAVVFTKRLVGLDGNAVESPFVDAAPREQLRSLAAVKELLPRYDLAPTDVTFAWTFTVGTMTKDLEALRAGLYGSGAFARLAEEFPVSTFDLWTRDEWRRRQGDAPLGAARGGDARAVIGGCASATWAELGGLADGDKQVCGGYADYASIGSISAGWFEAPDLLVDRDGHATKQYPATEDESWELDVERGEATYGKARVSFWCVLPRADAKPVDVACAPGNPQSVPWCKPYPVAFYAHGYGGFKGEFVLHAGRHAQMGVAACALDSYGHGRTTAFDPECPGGVEFLASKSRFSKYGTTEVLSMIFDGRDRDLNNDGCPDSGADQWTANMFHTRDMVRQSVLEQIQFTRILRAMDGTSKDADGRVLGDIDGDGAVDLGGPNAIIGAWGISLGGQITAVTAGAEPSLDAVSPNAVGAGLTDISVRLGQGGLAEAVMLPVMGPMLVGCLPTDGHDTPLSTGEARGCLPTTKQPEAVANQKANELLLAWYAHDTARFDVKAFAKVPGVSVGDRIEVENLDKQRTKSAVVGERGWLRVNVAADALSPIQRRRLLGFKDTDHAPKAFADTPALGDRFEVRVYGPGQTSPKTVVSSWHWDVTFQGTTYPKGAPLVAMQEGLGYARNTPDFRRFYGIASHAVAPADPASWAERYFQKPIQAPYDTAWRQGRNHVLVMPTVGDSQVPTAAGVALGRTSGLLGSWKRDPERFGPEVGWRELFSPDPRYGTSVEDFLRTNWVVEGAWHLQRFANFTYNPNVLFDPDDVSDGVASFSCRPEDDWSAAVGESRCPASEKMNPMRFPLPRPPDGKGLRIARPRADGTFDAFRVPLLRPAGQHGIYNPQPFRTFDADAYMVSFTARFLRTAGARAEHVRGCDCGFAERVSFTVNGTPAGPGLKNVNACPMSESYGKRCSPECARAWGIAVIPPSVCE
jgi:dienelactone hydrolase